MHGATVHVTDYSYLFRFVDKRKFNKEGLTKTGTAPKF